MAVTISAAMVGELRNKTGAGLMDCKRALVETNGDQDAVGNMSINVVFSSKSPIEKAQKEIQHNERDKRHKNDVLPESFAEIPLKNRRNRSSSTASRAV